MSTVALAEPGCPPGLSAPLAEWASTQTFKIVQESMLLMSDPDYKIIIIIMAYVFTWNHPYMVSNLI